MLLISPSPLDIDHLEIEKVTVYDYVAIWIDDTLTLKSHIDLYSNKSNVP